MRFFGWAGRLDPRDMRSGAEGTPLRALTKRRWNEKPDFNIAWKLNRLLGVAVIKPDRTLGRLQAAFITACDPDALELDLDPVPRLDVYTIDVMP